MGQTALADAMQRAGIDTDAALLRRIAVDELRKVGVNALAALTRFTEEVRDAGGIMAKLVPYSVTRDCARVYLEGVAADMRGDGLVPAKAGGGVRPEDDDQKHSGPVDNSEGEGSIADVQSPVMGGISPSDAVPSKDGGGVQPRADIHTISGSPEPREGDEVRPRADARELMAPSPSLHDRNGAVQPTSAVHQNGGRVVPMPRPARGLAAMQIHARVNSVYDSYQTRQGPIGDLIWSTLPRLASESAREAALLKLIYQHGIPADPNARVRDCIKVEDLQRMIQKAAEIANG